MLGQLEVNRWQFEVTNAQSPGLSPGTVVTPTTSNGAPTTWTEILSDASVTEDCYWVEVNINSYNASATVRGLLVDIGIDTAGGTSYVTIIPELMGVSAGQYHVSNATGNGGCQYYFPLYVPAGSAIAARGRGSIASATTFYVKISLYGRPSHPHLIKYGTRVEAIGTSTSDSQGTTFAAGNATEGSWTSLGTSAYDNFFWQVGYGATNTNQPSNSRYLDLAYDNDSTTPNIISRNTLCWSTTTEKISIMNRQDAWCFVPAGSTIYVRGFENAAPVATQKSAAWGVS